MYGEAGALPAGLVCGLELRRTLIDSEGLPGRVSARYCRGQRISSALTLAAPRAGVGTTTSRRSGAGGFRPALRRLEPGAADPELLQADLGDRSAAVF